MQTVKLTFSLGQYNRMYTLLDVPLHGEEIRARNKFIKIINPIVDDINKKREEILAEFSNKNEDGTTKFVNGLYDIPVEKREASLNKLREHLATTQEIECDKATVQSIRSILLNKAPDMKIEEGTVYDAILTILENV